MPATNQPRHRAERTPAPASGRAPTRGELREHERRARARAARISRALAAASTHLARAAERAGEHAGDLDPVTGWLIPLALAGAAAALAAAALWTRPTP